MRGDRDGRASEAVRCVPKRRAAATRPPFAGRFPLSAFRFPLFPPDSFLQLSLNPGSVGAVNEFLPPCAASGCPAPDLCPLNQVKAGTAVRIKQLAAPPEVSHRLRELGFCEEQQVRLVSTHVNVICQVCNARLGLSHQLAETILVEPLPSATSAAATAVLPVA